MVLAKKRELTVTQNILPPEMFEKIFKFLNFKEICKAQQVCRRWKMIIANGKLLEKASGNILDPFLRVFVTLLS